jgi:hypothetical protein
MYLPIRQPAAIRQGDAGASLPQFAFAITSNNFDGQPLPPAGDALWRIFIPAGGSTVWIARREGEQ